MWPLTFAVLQHSLHGTLPLTVPAHLGRAGALSVVRLPALPQVHLHSVIQQEQGWRGEAEQGHEHPAAGRGTTAQVLLGWQ